MISTESHTKRVVTAESSTNPYSPYRLREVTGRLAEVAQTTAMFLITDVYQPHAEGLYQSGWFGRCQENAHMSCSDFAGRLVARKGVKSSYNASYSSSVR